MKILTIIVTFNGFKWYDRCFNSILNSTIESDIYVIDNASSDSTINFIEDNYKSIILYQSTINLGFGQANNIGIEYAIANKYDYIFLLNQDAWLNCTDSLECLIRQAKLNPEYGILSPIQLYGDGNRLTTGFKQRILKYPHKNNDFVSDLYSGNQMKNIYDVNYVNAASWLISVDTIKKIGGFDSLFFMYGEDDNLLHRMIYHGYKIGVVTNSEVCHDVEFRGDDYNIHYNNYKKNLLVELLNINNKLNLRNYLLKSIISLFISIFKAKKIRINSYQRLCLVSKLYKHIKKSRLNNMILKNNE